MMAWVDRVGEDIVSDTHLPMASLDRARRILDTLEQDSRVRGKPVSAVCQEGGPYEEYRRRKDLDLEIRRGNQLPTSLDRTAMRTAVILTASYRIQHGAR